MLNFSILADGIKDAEYRYSVKSDRYTPNFEKIEFNPGRKEALEKYNLFEYYSLNLLGKDISIVTRSLPKSFRLDGLFGDLIFESDVYVLSKGIPFLFSNPNNIIRTRDTAARYNNKYGIGINFCEEESSFQYKFNVNLSKKILENEKLKKDFKEPNKIVKDSLLGLRSAYSDLVYNILYSNLIK